MVVIEKATAPRHKKETTFLVTHTHSNKKYFFKNLRNSKVTYKFV